MGVISLIQACYHENIKQKGDTQTEKITSKQACNQTKYQQKDVTQPHRK